MALAWAAGEVLDYRWCITLSAGFSFLVCLMTIGRSRSHVRAIYQREWENAEADE